MRTVLMKKTAAPFFALWVLASSAVGCGTLTGAAVGGATGAAVGAATDYSVEKSAIIGASVGGAAGALYDAYSYGRDRGNDD